MPPRGVIGQNRPTVLEWVLPRGPPHGINTDFDKLAVGAPRVARLIRLPRLDVAAPNGQHISEQFPPDLGIFNIVNSIANRSILRDRPQSAVFFGGVKIHHKHPVRKVRGRGNVITVSNQENTVNTPTFGSIIYAQSSVLKNGSGQNAHSTGEDNSDPVGRLSNAARVDPD